MIWESLWQLQRPFIPSINSLRSYAKQLNFQNVGLNPPIVGWGEGHYDVLARILQVTSYGPALYNIKSVVNVLQSLHWASGRLANHSNGCFRSVLKKHHVEDVTVHQVPVSLHACAHKQTAVYFYRVDYSIIKILKIVWFLNFVILTVLVITLKNVLVLNFCSKILLKIAKVYSLYMKFNYVNKLLG